jgi:hypothetical protein
VRTYTQACTVCERAHSGTLAAMLMHGWMGRGARCLPRVADIEVAVAHVQVAVQRVAAVEHTCSGRKSAGVITPSTSGGPIRVHRVAAVKHTCGRELEARRGEAAQGGEEGERESWGLLGVRRKDGHSPCSMVSERTPSGREKCRGT